MAHTVSRLGVKLLTVAVGIPVGILTKRVVERTWATVGPQGPAPADRPERSRVAGAAGYAALTAAATVVAQALSRRGGERAWHAITGLEPPAPPPSKEQKKAAKKAEQAQKEQQQGAEAGAAQALTG
ncbi:MAG: DUF4235 domain-containing protein [Jatrophihabitans sp.]|nr:MAG: DUF4235 domain-containing protein [Jatrophihabitans sp.]